MRYSDWKMVPANTWRWPSFSPREIACKGTGSVLINEDALDKLQALRNRLGKPLVLTSAYRSPEHNRAVGGAKASKHGRHCVRRSDGKPRSARVRGGRSIGGLHRLRILYPLWLHAHRHGPGAVLGNALAADCDVLAHGAAQAAREHARG